MTAVSAIPVRLVHLYCHPMLTRLLGSKMQLFNG
jgi:hypothetical protein